MGAVTDHAASQQRAGWIQQELPLQEAPDMPYYYSKAYSATGSSMGRRNGTSERLDVKLLHVERVPINQGGYDPGGAYWGTGQPLYVAWGEGPEYFTRAANRQEAKEAAALVFPNAKFYR